MNECEHIYGIWSSEFGSSFEITNPDSIFYDDPDTRKFKFCPECGKQLIKD